MKNIAEISTGILEECPTGIFQECPIVILEECPIEIFQEYSTRIKNLPPTLSLEYCGNIQLEHSRIILFEYCGNIPVKYCVYMSIN